MKLLVIGMDGMDYNYTMEYISKYIYSNDDYGVLKSYLSKGGIPHTGPCWASIYTGETPRVHGITSGGWLTKHKNWSDLKCSTMFPDIAKKYKLGLMTMPVTFPAKEVGEWMVSGFPSPTYSTKKTYNVTLPEGFKVDYLNIDEHSDLLKNQTAEKLYEVEKEKLELAKSLPEVEVLFIGYTLLDRIGHNSSKEKFKRTYELGERLLTETEEAFNPETLLICADHGMSKESGEWAKHGRHNLDGFYLIRPSRGYGTTQSILNIRNIISDILGLDDMEKQLKSLGYI